jgi:hypothetical protein
VWGTRSRPVTAKGTTQRSAAPGTLASWTKWASHISRSFPVPGRPILPPHPGKLLRNHQYPRASLTAGDKRSHSPAQEHLSRPTLVLNYSTQQFLRA